MRLICCWLSLLLAGLSPAAAEIPSDIEQALRHRGHALLIGVSDYTSGWDQLPSVKDDLQDLKAGLDPYFETVDTITNPTVDQLRDRVRDFLLGRWNRPNERLFIYYSGHGFTDFNQSSRQNDGYITGSDTPLYNQADGRAVAKSVPFIEVDSWNRQTRARHVLMVFDSCFSGSLFQTKAAIAEPNRNEIDGVRRMLGQPMRYYITAGRQNEEVAADSTFATLLLRGLRGEADVYHEGIISAEELGIYLYHKVLRYSQRPQTPQFNSIANAPLSEGQFFFLPKSTSARERRLVHYNNGDYDGEFLDDKKNGRGVYTWPNGERYDGEWRDDQMTGHGVYTRPDGSRYDGEWRNGQRTGRGVYVSSNGERYDGEWRDDKMTGHGVYTRPDGNRYDGEWRNGQRTGRGVFAWPNGDRYDGEWRDDKMNGRGVFTWGEGKWKGDRYDGEWLDYKRSGHGIYTYADGRRNEGIWRDNQLVSRTR